MLRTWITRLAFLVVLLATFSAARAQNNAGLTGVVTDATGAVVSDATVILTNPSTGVKFTDKTDAKGSYRFPIVEPNSGYVVTVTQSGFSTFVARNLVLQVGITHTQDAVLRAGETSAVEVNASASEVTLNTTDFSVGNNFDPQELNELPVQNRASVASLFTLQPGVTSTGSVTGARTDQTQVTLDGMDVNDISTGTAFGSTVGAPVDAIQEFRGTVAGQPASNVTGGGGVFQLVTKNGTNRFHGNLNEYHRDPTTQANTWFNDNIIVTPTSPVLKAKLVQNQFGGNIGGPILIPKLYNGRDKAFFFFDFNNSRTAQTSQANRTVPLDSFRNGIIGYTNNSSAACTTASTRASSPTCISDFTPAQAAALDPKGIGEDTALFAYINSRYPRSNNSNVGDGVNTGGYQFSQKYLTNLYNYVGRIDYNLTSKQHIFIRGIYNKSDGLQALNQFDVDPVTAPNANRSYGYVASHVWEIGSNKVNQFYYGDTINVLNFPVNFLPTLTPIGATSFTFGPLTAPNGSLSSQSRRVPIPEIRDDFNWQVGSHTINFGGTFKYIKTHSSLTNDYNFVGVGLGGNTTALNSTLEPSNLNANTTLINRYDSAFTFALGRLGTQSRNYNYDASGNALALGTGSQRAYRSYQSEFYVGDTWKTTKSLTLSYGLRYSLYSTPYEVNGRQTNQSYTFDDYFAARLAQTAASASGNSAVPFITYSLGGKANNAPAAFGMSYKDFAPRFGFTYNPGSAKNTVIDGGFALTFDRSVYNALNFIQDQLSYFFANNQAVAYGQTSANAALLADPRLGANLAIPAAPPPVAISRSIPYAPYVSATGVPTGIVSGSSNYAIDSRFKSPYNLTFNAGVQQKMPGNIIMNLNYAGRLGRRLIAQADDSQLIDFRDPASGQLMSQAFAGLATDLRNGATSATVNKQPWFENQVVYPTTNKTALVAANQATNSKIGDIGDVVKFLQANGILAKNVGLPGQFAANTVITNKGYSQYHGLLFNLTKNTSNGLQFRFNYTWSHSTDNVSVIANTIGLNTGMGQVCDVLVRRSCYGNSDFDVTNTVTSDFVYALPVGRGKRFLGHANPFIDAALGGWSVSGIPGWRSGIAFTTTTGAYMAGYANNDPAIVNGNLNLLHRNLHKQANGAAAGRLVLFDDQFTVNAGSVGTGATGIFRNPLGLEYGSRNVLRGPGAATFDAGLAKRFQIVPEKVSFQIRGDAFNVLNHPTFATPSVVNINSAPFGQITAQNATTANGGARLVQVSGRIEF